MKTTKLEVLGRFSLVVCSSLILSSCQMLYRYLDPLADSGINSGSSIGGENITTSDGGEKKISDGSHPPDVVAAAPSCAIEKGIRFCKIIAGSFHMGRNSSDPCYQNVPQRIVSLTHNFYIGETEITTSTFAGSGTSLYPKTNVSWHAAANFCNNLTTNASDQCYSCSGTTCTLKYTGNTIYNCKGYRLPTEAEYEYVLRAGTTTAFFDGDSNYDSAITSNCGGYTPNGTTQTRMQSRAHYGDISGSIGPKEAKNDGTGRIANAWGLFDMAGNVSEWIHDPSTQDSTSPVTNPINTGTSYMARGGNYKSYLIEITSFNRLWASLLQTDSNPQIGFRCVRSE